MTEQQNTTTHRALLYNTAMLGFEDAMLERRSPTRNQGAPLVNGHVYDVVTVSPVIDPAVSPVIETDMARLDRQRSELHEVQLRVVYHAGPDTEPGFSPLGEAAVEDLPSVMKRAMRASLAMNQTPEAVYFMLVQD